MTNFDRYRYGTMSSLERLPSDETDDGNVRLTEPDTTKNYNAGNNLTNELPNKEFLQ